MADLIAQSVFYEMAALLILAAVAGLIGLALRQPLVVAFIAVGIIAGPSVLDIARSDQHIDLLASLGIAVLLFLVGLKLDLKLVRTLGKTAVVTGLGQVAFTAAIGFVIVLGLGFGPVAAVYIAVALTFSSTIIIVKLLSDKREIDSLHGRVALGFLIVQDIVVVLAMIVLSALGVGAEGAGEGQALAAIGRVVGYGLAALAAVAVFVRYVAEPLTRRLAKAPELLVAFAIGWAALLAAAGDVLGFGKELGGLLAGVSLASTPVRDAVAARLASLRDFLLLFFFIALGAGLDLGRLGDQVIPALVLSVFVLVGNPLIVMVLMGWLGYRRRTGFLAGLTVAQISEFSLIFIAVGVTLGHVDDEALGLVTLVGLITIALSTYMITWSHALHRRLDPLLTPFERKRPTAEEAMAGPPSGADVLLFGLGRYGRAIGRRLTERGYDVLGVDFDPEAVMAWRDGGGRAVFGDASDPEFVGHLPVARSRLAIAAMPSPPSGLSHEDPRIGLATTLRDQGFTGPVVAARYGGGAADALPDGAADLVLDPFSDAADHAVERIAATLDPEPATAPEAAPEAAPDDDADRADPATPAGREAAPC
ncbi:MAG: sodium:proton exchanger [Alphaproteobacteria bacterium]|nr:sodium:proton exchanger [Alphaproteobacteria bacterium]